jgi:hypothetical protein
VRGQGSVIIWSNKLIHATAKPRRGRACPKPRFLVYGGCVPQSKVTAEERARRAEAFSLHCQGEDRREVLELLRREGPRLLRLMALPGLEGVLGGIESDARGVGHHSPGKRPREPSEEGKRAELPTCPVRQRIE